MNPDQMAGIVRQVLTAFGMMATMFGWMAPEKVAILTANVLAIVGPASIIASTVWGWIAKTKANMLTSVAKMPEVNNIQLNPTTEGRELAQPSQTPNNVQLKPH